MRVEIKTKTPLIPSVQEANNRGSTLFYHFGRNGASGVLPFAPGRTFIPLPHPGFQPPTQALYRFRWDYSFRSSRYEILLDCTTEYIGLSSHPMSNWWKCSRTSSRRGDPCGRPPMSARKKGTAHRPFPTIQYLAFSQPVKGMNSRPHS